MNNKYIIKLFNTIFTIYILFCLQGCAENDKQMLLANDVKEDIVLEESEINNLINKGNDFLNASESDKAKECYEKAISLDITKESTYLTIKNNYVKSNRYDDAYYIIKLAIDNNVSRENMNNILTDIKSHFNPTLIAVSIYEGDTYTLPGEVSMPINNIDTKVPVRWNNSKADTSNAGTFNFDGCADEYGRTAHLTLTINKKSETAKKTESKNTKNSEEAKTSKSDKNSTSENRKQKYIEKLDKIKASLSDLEELSAGSTVEMRLAANTECGRWDTALNEIYSDIKKSLSSSDAAKLEKEELEWIKTKELKAKEAAAQYEGGSLAPLCYDASVCQTTKERCYELVNKYM